MSFGVICTNRTNFQGGYIFYDNSSFSAVRCVDHEGPVGKNCKKKSGWSNF